MSHELGKKFDGEYRMAYRYRSDDDRPWHDAATKCLKWMTDMIDLEQVKIDLEANTPIQLRDVKCSVTGENIPEIQQTWRPVLDAQGNALLDENGMARGQRLGIVGPEYTIIQDYECIDWLKPWIEAGHCTVETGGAIFGGSRFWVLVKMTKDPIDIVKDDPIEQYVLIFNGHDGKLAFRAFPTVVRVVCNNTAMVACQSALAKRFRAKHRKLVHMKTEDIRDEVGKMQGLLVETSDKFRILAAHDVPDEKHLKAYFQQVIGEKIDLEKEIKADGKRPLATMMRLFDEGIGSDMSAKDTWWMAYNAVTEYATHMRGRNSDSRLDNMIVGAGAALTDRALKLGLDAAIGNLKLAA